MVDAVVSGVVELLGTILAHQIEQEVKLVVGVKEEIRSLTRKFVLIRAVLDDAEKRQVNESSVRLWLADLKHVSYDVEDVLDEWSTAILKSTIQRTQGKEETTDQICCVTKSLKKVCSVFPSHCFRFNRLVLRYDIAHKIKQLNVRLDAIENESRAYSFIEKRGVVEPERQITASVVDVSEVHGRDKEKDELLSMLLSDSSQQISGLCIISIVGMGGLGKTTLARLVYNEDLIKAHFDLRAWVCVSDPFDEKRIARSILEALSGTGASNVNELQTLLHLMSESLSGKKFFLVLDDMWTDDYRKWEQLRDTLKCCSHGSRVLVTTRKDTVSDMLGTKHLLKPSPLSEKACWSLFSQVAFFGKSNEECANLEDLGRNIVRKCNGLPLAANFLGSLLRFKKRREEWESVLYDKIWELNNSERLFASLLLSYHDLSPSMRRCFSYCAVFPKDYCIGKDELIYMWMAQGLLSSTQNKKAEEVGEEYIDILVARSFFQYLDNEGYKDKNVSMHDLVHDLAQYLTMGECFLVESHEGDQEASKVKHFGSKARHLTVLLKRDAQFPDLVDVGKKLHTMRISLSENYSMEDGVRSSLFDQLTHLRTLHVDTDVRVRKLPENMGKLVHLRYLNLSRHKRLEELPESVCDLCNLQTLNINYCLDLKRLPCGMSKLVNLRHIENKHTNSLRFMPKGIKQLTSLLTIKEFMVSEDDNDNDNEAMTLGDLKSFKSLRGSLTIRRLGNLADVEEAKQAICHMKHVVELKLNFGNNRAERVMNERAERVMNEVVLEALQPPPQLQELHIYNYGGATMFPSWLTSLTKLTCLVMRHFGNLEHLPPLGKLSSLETLRIEAMPKVKTVGVEFMESTSSSVSPFVAFPKLKTLVFYGMRNWEEWNCGMRTEEAFIFGRATRRIITMPQLCSLYLTACPELKTLPGFLLQKLALEERHIYYCPNLRFDKVHSNNESLMCSVRPCLDI